MKVIYFHQHFSTPAGSGGIRSYRMARALVQSGHEVIMVCGSHGLARTGLAGDFRRGMRRGMVDGIHVIEFELPYSNNDGFLRRALTFLRFAWRSCRVVFIEKHDLVFATTTPLTAGIPGIVARWLLGSRFVFEVRDLWPELPRAMGVIRNPTALWALGVLEWLSYRSADRLIGLSPGIVRGISRRGVCETRIKMIPNGCDIDMVADQNEVWRPHNVAVGDLVVVFTGTHGIANGLDAVLDAARELQERRRTDIKFFLIGSGMKKNELRDRAVREGLLNVTFIDSMEKRKLFQVLLSADVGLQVLRNVPAFYYGTSPNKFFDYISAGLPVLCNYPGWVSDIIGQNTCGFVVPPVSPGAFADALEHAADNRSALAGMGIRARAVAARDFDRRELAEQWVAWVTSAPRGHRVNKTGSSP
jgi:glycosyltransferase involved in cell wall biosynthesis